jgi:drug/metabolite transporter (DMT)-like permease
VALLVTALWSSSFVLIKRGLADIPPLYFATLRYALAFAILLAVMAATRRSRKEPLPAGRRRWVLLTAAGLAGYTVAQGFQYVGLYYLPAVTTSLVLNFTPFFVILLGASFLDERVSVAQVGALGVAVLGAVVYFSEKASGGGDWFGVLVVVSSGVGWAVYVAVVRMVQKSGGMGSLSLTTITMGAGVGGMAALTAATREYAPLSAAGVETVVFLAVVNTAFAFLAWNWTLKAIPAYELTVLQDLMLVEIAAFSLVFLGEVITPVMYAGIALVLAGVVLVQLKGRRPL